MKDRFRRQISFLGTEGQQNIKSTKVCVIGVGGIGSHVIQQLSFLGVENITIIDDDKLEESNRNRLIGVRSTDQNGKLKVDIAERTIKEIEQEINIIKIPYSVLTKKSLQAILNCDLIFGCIDNDGARLFINEVSLAYEIPYFDISSEILVEDKELGGRIILVTNGNPCLFCLDEIDSNEARRYLENGNARKDEEAIYGIPKNKLNGSGPSVVTLNGIMSSLACNEFMLHVTGIRDAFNYITFYGSTCMVRKRKDEVKNNCYYCNTLKGKGDIENLINKYNLTLSVKK